MTDIVTLVHTQRLPRFSIDLIGFDTIADHKPFNQIGLPFR